MTEVVWRNMFGEKTQMLCLTKRDEEFLMAAKRVFPALTRMHENRFVFFFLIFNSKNLAVFLLGGENRFAFVFLFVNFNSKNSAVFLHVEESHVWLSAFLLGIKGGACP
jgi:hypothetical protein